VNRLERLRDYARGGHKAVEGWLNPRSALMIAGLSLLQRERGFAGAVGEIGVHHGRLFILLALGAGPDESCFAIDVFERQELNLDEAGRGDREIFARNLRDHGLDPDKVHIVTASSLDVDGNRLRGEIGAVRLLSIDGGHGEECVRNDLGIADALLADHGVVILDDVFNANWPSVISGYARYLLDDPATIPFAISPNKVYACRPRFVTLYRDFMRSSFSSFFRRSSRLFDFEVECFGASSPVRQGE
jgi:hypothetical protein